MLIVYVDTNILMEHEPLDQLPLDDIVGDRVDHVVIPYQVLKEIDAHKYSTDKRARRRAEAAGKLIARLRSKGALPNGAGVSVKRPKSFDYAQHDLDPTSQDDRVIAAVIQQREAGGGDRHILLTADQHFAVLAEELGVEHVVMQGHRLQEGEPEDHIRRPRPKLTFDDDGVFVEAMVPLPPDAEQIAADAIETLWLPAQRQMTVMKSGPMAALADMQWPGRWPTKREQVEAHAKALYNYGRITLSAVPVILRVHNDGKIPADDVDVILRFPQGFVAFEEDELPDYPVSRDPYNFNLAGIRGSALPRPITGPFAERHDDGTTTVRYHLQRVKHGMSTSLDPVYVVPRDTENVGSCGFEYAIHAGNLETPVTDVLHLKLVSSERLDFAAIRASYYEEDEEDEPLAGSE